MLKRPKGVQAMCLFSKMVEPSFWLVVSIISGATARKDEYFENSISAELEDFVDDYDLEGWLILALLCLLTLCCFGRCISCCLGCFHRHDDRRKPLLDPYRDGGRPTYYLPTLSQNPSYVPPSAPPIYVDSRSAAYPYLPPA